MWMDELMDVYLTDVQQVMELQLLVDCEPVSFQLFLFLLSCIMVLSFYGTMFLHIIQAQMLSHLKIRRENRKEEIRGC